LFSFISAFYPFEIYFNVRRGEGIQIYFSLKSQYQQKILIF
jgi:hypothetical protein